MKGLYQTRLLLDAASTMKAPHQPWLKGLLLFRCDHPEAFKCWALDAVGKRKAEVQLQTQKNIVQFRLSHEHQAVYYELSAE